MATQPKKTCFVIGPMGGDQIKRLEWLAAEVIQPILGDDYAVFTPDVSIVGSNVMHHVIRSCDRADLVVADTTGNNPNVLYEMAILDLWVAPASRSSSRSMKWPTRCRSIARSIATSFSNRMSLLRRCG